jgi:hypothetical protein
MLSLSKDVESKKQHTNCDSRTNTCTLTITIHEYYTKTEQVTALYPGDKEKLPSFQCEVSSDN